LLEGGHVCWLGPSEKTISEAKSWVRAWLAPLIVPGNPGNIGFDFSNGARLDFHSIGPNAPLSVRGRGYSLAVCDEAAHIENLRMILDAAVKPALALAGGRMLMISTPRGHNHFFDYYQEAEREGVAISAPSSVNPNLKPSELEHLRRTTAPIIFEQEYEAQFVEMAGCLLKREYLCVADPPSIESFQTICFGIDLALATHERSDYSALCVTGIAEDRRLWVLHGRRWRKTWPETVALLADYNRAWCPHLAVCEQVSFQELGVRDLIKAGLPLIGLKVSKGKEERFLPVLTKYALRMIWHSASLDSELEAELLSFPESSHDDFVDALVYGVGGLDSEIRSAWAGGNPSAELWRGLPHEHVARPEYDKWGNLWEGDIWDGTRQITELGRYVEPCDVGYLAPGLLEKTFPVGCIPGARMPIERPE
jgi:predicted phage terminase large subunit-like protein